MKGKYKSYFLIPSDASRFLGGDGWEFQSTNRVPKKLLGSLMLGLNLTKSVGDVGIERFSGRNAEAVVFMDEADEIEHIYLRAYGDRDIGSELLNLLSDDSLGFEIFDPSKASGEFSEPPQA